MKKKPVKLTSLNYVAQIIGFMVAAFFLAYALLESFKGKALWYPGVAEPMMFGGSILVFVSIAKSWLLVGASLLIIYSLFIVFASVISSGAFHISDLIGALLAFIPGFLFLIDYYLTKKLKKG